MGSFFCSISVWVSPVTSSKTVCEEHSSISLLTVYVSPSALTGLGSINVYDSCSFVKTTSVWEFASLIIYFSVWAVFANVCTKLVWDEAGIVSFGSEYVWICFESINGFGTYNSTFEADPLVMLCIRVDFNTVFFLNCGAFSSNGLYFSPALAFGLIMRHETNDCVWFTGLSFDYWVTIIGDMFSWSNTGLGVIGGFTCTEISCTIFLMGWSSICNVFDWCTSFGRGALFCVELVMVCMRLDFKTVFSFGAGISTLNSLKPSATRAMGLIIRHET